MSRPGKRASMDERLRTLGLAARALGDLRPGCCGLRVGEVEGGADHGERAAQFVGAVGDEALPPVCRVFQTPEHVAHGVSESADLVAPAVSGTRRERSAAVISATVRRMRSTERKVQPASSHAVAHTSGRRPLAVRSAAAEG